MRNLLLATVLMAFCVYGCIETRTLPGGGDDGDAGLRGRSDVRPSEELEESCVSSCEDTWIAPSADTIGGGEDTLPGEDAIDAGCDATCAGKCGTIGECVCGDYDAGFECVANVCVEPIDCETACANKECGNGGVDGCNCGECDAELTCNETTGMCEETCVADCEGKQCGPDGCGGSCGLCPCVGCDPTFIICDEVSGQCVGQEELTCAGIVECFSACNANDQVCFQD